MPPEFWNFSEESTVRTLDSSTSLLGGGFAQEVDMKRFGCAVWCEEALCASVPAPEKVGAPEAFLTPDGIAESLKDFLCKLLEGNELQNW
jgi:hypothetical protein